MSDDPLVWDIPDDPYHSDPIVPCYGDTPSLGDSEIGKTLFGLLNDMTSTSLAGQVTKIVPLEHVLKFLDGYHAISPAAADVAPGHRDSWRRISEALHIAETQLRDAIGLAQSSMSGATVSAILQKANDSIGYLTSLADAAKRMDPLVDTFSRDISETKSWFETMNKQLNDDLYKLLGQNQLGDYTIDQQQLDDLMTIYDNKARTAIQDFYNPPIEWVSQRHPDTSADPPRAPGVPGGVPTSPAGAGAPPGGPGPGGLGLPEMPALPTKVPSDPSTGRPTTPTGPSNAMPNIGDAAKGVGDAANDAAQKAHNAAGRAGNAASQALGQLGKGGPNGPAGLPEGVLGLGPNGLKGAKPSSGSGAGRGGGGAAARLPVVGKPSAQLAPASNAATSAPVSRAGAGAGAGSGAGSGAPVAGHRGGAGADKQHKVSKALRHSKHGQEVIGEADAVVPVVGEQPEEPTPAKPA